MTLCDTSAGARLSLSDLALYVTMSQCTKPAPDRHQTNSAMKIAILTSTLESGLLLSLDASMMVRETAAG
jgi:hypothetical protein